MKKVLGGRVGVVFYLLLLLEMNISLSLAQLPTATILGTVKDSSGAVVPSTTVTVRNLETGLTRTQQSGETGSYRFAALPVGTYEIRAEQEGFQTEVRSGVGLAVAQEAVVNFSLEVGAVEQTISVTAEASPVNTTNASLGALVNEKQVSDLPLKGRNFADLALLQPGVAQHRPISVTLSAVGNWISINGAPPRSNFYLLDGAPMNNYGDASTASSSDSTLGVEAIREWRVVTNALSAEYGMRMGGQMVIVTKNGTNEFHGSLFEFFRNSAMDARNFFDYQTEVFKGRLPGFRRNQYGGSLGGPIKKDKLFFFTTYEGLKERLGVTTVTNTIGAGCQGPAGATITNVACPQLGTTQSVTVAPVIAPLLALFPAPNLPGNRYTFPFTQPTDEHYGMVRGDYNLSTNDNVFFRYTIDDAKVTQARPYPQWVRGADSRSQFLTVSNTHTFGPTLLGVFRFSNSQPGLGVSTISDVIGPQYSFSPDRLMGVLQIGGITELGADRNTPSFSNLNVFTASGDGYYSRGRHSLKFGTLINHYKYEVGNGSGYYGIITFSNLATFLRGIATGYQTKPTGTTTVFNPVWVYWNTVGFYLQDDVRVRSNLMLNLGLRYEFHTEVRPAREDKNFPETLRDVQRDSAFTPGGPYFLNPSLKNISPRFGFAWDVRGDGKTAVRGGLGMLYDVSAYGQMISGTVSPEPFPGRPQLIVASAEYPQLMTLTSLPLVFPTGALGTSASTMDYRLQNPHTLHYNLTVERQLPYDLALSLGYVGSRGINLAGNQPANPRPPTVLPDGRFYWAGTESRINPSWGQISVMTAPFNSLYNSLQFSLTKRLSRGLQFQSAYTWSKLLDQRPGITGPDNGGSPVIVNQLLPLSLAKGPGEYDLAHAWRFNAIYRLPEAPGRTGLKGALLDGWWVAGILTAQTGLPFTPMVGGADQSRSLTSATVHNQGPSNVPDLNPGRWRPNIISGTTAGCPGVAAGQRLGGPELYYDPCAFTLQPPGFIGTVGRNILTAPGLANLDFSLVKEFKPRFLGEGGNVQFRTEIFNVLNRTNFSRPNMQAFSAPSPTPPATAGRITGTDTRSRQVQLSLKILF